MQGKPWIRVKTKLKCVITSKREKPQEIKERRKERGKKKYSYFIRFEQE